MFPSHFILFINLVSHLHYSLVLIFTPVMNTSQTEPGESVIFQPVLQAYPTRHSWIVTAHISLGNLEWHWKLFKRQLTRTQQFLRSLEQHPSTSPQLLTTLQLELSNIQDIYKSNKISITSAVNLLNSNQPQTTTRCKRSLLPFLGTALSWLTGTATTKDICSIRTRINQLIATQSSQCDTLVHIVSILNVTRYATQVNRHSINSLIDALHTATQDIDNLYNVTTSLASSITFNQMILHIRSVFANLRDSMQYLHTISTHTMDYIDAATSGILSPHVLPVVDLWKMLLHIADTLPPTLHLPISPVDTLHFYQYLCTHVLIENKQFLLLINIPIQDRAHQITIHQVFTLDIPHGNYSASLWHQHSVLWSHQGCNNGTRTILHTIWSMQTGKWTVLPHFNAFSTFGKPTNMHRCSVCQKYSQHRIQVFSTATQSYNHPSPYTDHARCLDTCNPYFSPYRHHKFDMPWEAYGNYPNQTTTTCTTATNGLQCHFSKLLPATKVWNTHLECQCFIKYGKPMSYQHHCSTFLCLATHGKQSQWNRAPTSCYPTIHTSTQGISTSSQQLLTIDTLQHAAIRRYKHSMEPVHPPRNIHFSFRLNFTSWSWIILLLFLLVLTCQISAPTLKIR